MRELKTRMQSLYQLRNFKKSFPIINTMLVNKRRDWGLLESNDVTPHILWIKICFAQHNIPISRNEETVKLVRKKMTEYFSLGSKAVEDMRREGRTPARAKISSFSCSFREKLAK